MLKMEDLTQEDKSLVLLRGSEERGDYGEGGKRDFMSTLHVSLERQPVMKFGSEVQLHHRPLHSSLSVLYVSSLQSALVFRKMSWEPLVQGHLEDTRPTPSSSVEELRVIEWDHMNLKLFYPLALTSTWTVRTVLHPLTVLRSRLQLQKQKTVYRSTAHAFLSIAKSEGLTGLYRGFWVTVPQIGTSFIYTTVYERLRASLQSDWGWTSVEGISSIAGGAAAFCSQSIFVPTDVIAQYMMIYKQADKFMSGRDRAVIERLRSDGYEGTRRLGARVIKAIYAIDGFAGFYRGFWASSLVYVPSCLAFWPTYYWLQDLMKRSRGEGGGGVLLLDQAITATIGGAVSSIVTNPMEVFRIRVQVHRTTYAETLSRMARTEGWAIFTKGLAPRIIQNGIYSCIVMVGYELVKRLCVLPEYRHAVKW